MPSNSAGDYTVAPKRKANMVKADIDIRNQGLLELFAGYEWLMISIYMDPDRGTGWVVVDVVDPAGATLPTHGSTGLQDCRTTPNRAGVGVYQPYTIEGDVGGRVDFTGLDQGEAKAWGAGSIGDLLHKLRQAKRVASLCSGGGFWDLAWALAGWQIEWVLDIDHNALATHRRNLGCQTIQADLLQYDLHQIPKVPVLIGGPPCVGLTNENRRNGGRNHPQNRLIFRFTEAVNVVKPLAFAMENVPQLLTMDGGALLESIREAVPDYTITAGILCAADYGDPMLRPRAIIVGSLIGPIPLPAPIFSPARHRTVRDAFKGLDPSLPNQQEYSQFGEAVGEMVRYIPQGGSWADTPEEIRGRFHPGTHSNKYRRLAWDRPAHSMVNPRKSPTLHPEEDRVVTVREHARLLSVPDGYVIEGGLTAGYLQLGNAGTGVRAGCHVARTLWDKLEQYLLRTMLGFEL